MPDEKLTSLTDPGDKTRVLCLFDSPTTATGFAQVSRNLLKVLNATGEYHFTVIGINHSDFYDQQRYPYVIYEASPALTTDIRYRDLYGRQRLLDFIGTGQFDILFTLQDTFIMEDISEYILAAKIKMKQKNKEIGTTRYRPFKWINYYPIDGTPMPNWINKSAILADYPVTYTNFAKRETIDAGKKDIPDNNRLDYVQELEQRVRVVYHGTNLEDFKYLEDREAVKQFRHDYFQGLADDKFIIINVNRNQPRKDLFRTMAAFDKFLETHPDSFLYLHCQANDQLGNMLEVARSFTNIQIGKNFSMPHDFGANKGVSIEELNKIYNSADALVTTTLGEGWGLSLTEAMACHVPVIAPRNTSIPEILGENDERGLTYNSGTTPSLHTVIQLDNNVVRPLADIDDLIAKLTWVKEHIGTPDLQAKIDAAAEWVKQYTWDGANVGDKWKEIFSEASKSSQLDRELANLKTIGRNDPCPCGSGKKYKVCHST